MAVLKPKSVPAYECADGTLVLGKRAATLYNHRLDSVFPVLTAKISQEFSDLLKANLPLVEQLLATKPAVEEGDDEPDATGTPEA